MSPVSGERAKPGILLACEKTPQSRVSPNPGIVKDGESLARTVYCPSHINNDGRIDLKFITVGDLQKGCSFDREDVCRASDIDKRGADRARKKGRKYIGYATVGTGRIREITDEDGMRALCVLDDAEKKNQAHAIVKIIREDYGVGKIRGIRKQLFNLMTFPPGHAPIEL